MSDLTSLEDRVSLIGEQLLSLGRRHGRLWYRSAVANVSKACVPDGLPVPSISGATVNLQTYWNSGKADYDDAMEACAAASVQVRRSLDFGCSTGRVYRHFLRNHEIEAWACDQDAGAIGWCADELGAKRAITNGILPRLPFEDASFDLVTAIEVFDRMDELETMWLTEVMRVLRPGGVAFITNNDETAWPPENSEAVRFLRASLTGGTLDLGAPLSEKKTVFQSLVDGGIECRVWRTEAYVRLNWGRFFRIEEIRRRDGFQPAVVCVRE